MQSTNIRQIKAALRDQAFFGQIRVSCPMGTVVAESQEKGATPRADPRVGPLIPRGECAH